MVVILILAIALLGHHFKQYLDRFPASSATTGSFSLSSSAFSEGGSIPSQYTCDAKQISPPLSIHGAPDATKSFALIVEDRDVPKNLKPDGVFLHWVMFNIPGATREIGVGEIAGSEGASGNGVAGYVGPCPPPEYDPAEHHYYFDLYALDAVLNLSQGADVSALRSTMEGHIIAHTTLTARYARMPQ